MVTSPPLLLYRAFDACQPASMTLSELSSAATRARLLSAIYRCNLALLLACLLVKLLCVCARPMALPSLVGCTDCSRVLANVQSVATRPCGRCLLLLYLSNLSVLSHHLSPMLYSRMHVIVSSRSQEEMGNERKLGKKKKVGTKEGYSAELCSKSIMPLNFVIDVSMLPNFVAYQKFSWNLFVCVVLFLWKRHLFGNSCQIIWMMQTVCFIKELQIGKKNTSHIHIPIDQFNFCKCCFCPMLDFFVLNYDISISIWRWLNVFWQHKRS